MSWDSKQYLKFQRERTQPSIDLADRLAAQSPAAVIDIGCGPGNSTAILKKHYPNAAVTGADNSDIMEWYKGTGLRPYLEALSETDSAEFERDVFAEVQKAYPKQANGEIIFRFPRLFFKAEK